MGILELYGSGPTVSGFTGLMKIGKEVIREWRLTGNTRLVRESWDAPEDSGSREDV